MTNSTTTAELQRDGWRRKTINGVPCLKLLVGDYKYLIGPGRDPYLSPHDFYDITAKLGEPQRIHTLSISDGHGSTVYGITSLEFALLVDDAMLSND